MSSEAAHEVLVRLTGVTQELTVGVGAAIASVRTLSNVSLVIRSGELIVLSGARGAGERALLAVIAGDRRGVSGHREMHESVRLRSLRISASSALALAEEWQRAQVEYGGSGDTGAAAFADSSNPRPDQPAQRRDVFLLDVVADPATAPQPEPGNVPAGSRRHWRARKSPGAQTLQPAAWQEKNRAALHAWAYVCQRHGGAVVMGADEELGLCLIHSGEMRRPDVPAHATSRLGVAAATIRETPVFAPAMRVISMHCGRLAASIPIALRSRVRVS